MTVRFSQTVLKTSRPWCINTEGHWVGVTVGTVVGPFVGVTVGTVDGPTVGVKVGTTVGVNVPQQAKKNMLIKEN